MESEVYVQVLKKGAKSWNPWKARMDAARLSSTVQESIFKGGIFARVNLTGVDLSDTDLSGVNLSSVILSEAKLSGANLTGADLSKADLSKADLMQAILSRASLQEAKLTRALLNCADLTEANLRRADLNETCLRGADFMRANLTLANLEYADAISVNLQGANLEYAYLRETNFQGANLARANLTGATLDYANLWETNLTKVNLKRASLIGARFVRTNVSQAKLTDCNVYGLSAWDLKGVPKSQENLVITRPQEPEITVDDLEVAQFIYLILTNKKLKSIIDTITSKAVLILGRFTEERKAVLEAIREELRKQNFTPILFDFEKPASKDVLGTVETIARMVRFIVADLTDPSSIPLELGTVVPFLTTTPVLPIKQKGSAERFTMFEDLRRRYKDWVLATYEYQDEQALIAALPQVIKPANDIAKALMSSI